MHMHMQLLDNLPYSIIICTPTLRGKREKVKLICMIRTHSTQIYLLMQSALLGEFNSFHYTFFHKNYKKLLKYFTLIQSIFVVYKQWTFGPA